MKIQHHQVAPIVIKESRKIGDVVYGWSLNNIKNFQKQLKKVLKHFDLPLLKILSMSIIVNSCIMMMAIGEIGLSLKIAFRG